MKTSIAFLFLLFVSLAQAKTILISDIDDTIKVSNINGPLKGVDSVLNKDVRFAGLSEIYQNLILQNHQLQVYYVSSAPKYVMESRHKTFLRNGNFPQGELVLRVLGSSENFKTSAIEKIIEIEKPTKVILVGDNGEHDPQAYRNIQQKYPQVSVQVFIHLVYDPSLKPIAPNQIGYAYAAELAFHLMSLGFLNPESANNLMTEINDKLLIEDQLKEKSFPEWLNCKGHQFNYTGTWQLLLTHNMVKEFCQ